MAIIEQLARRSLDVIRRLETSALARQASSALKDAALRHEPLAPPVAGEHLWLDRDDALAELRRRTDDPWLLEHAGDLIIDGFTRLPRLIEAEACDQLVTEFQEYCRQHREAVGAYRDGHGHHERMANFHMRSETVLRIGHHRQLLKLLDFVFGHKAAFYSSLLFEKGSQQAIHHDSPFFRTDPEGFFFGVWTALEDVHPDAGPLHYHVGGHRVRPDPHALAAELKLGAADLYHEYGRRLAAECQRRALPVETAKMRQGDVLIWHPWLPHGGQPIRDPARTRNSLVVHYIPDGSVVHNLESFFDRAQVNPSKKFDMLTFADRRYVYMGEPAFAHNY
jgi:phytanoyl-CoA hydroxylase